LINDLTLVHNMTQHGIQFQYSCRADWQSASKPAYMLPTLIKHDCIIM